MDCTSQELRELIEAVHESTGSDFRDYGPESLKRRALRCAAEFGMPTLGQFRERVIGDPAAMERLRFFLTVPVTAMFRDPEFFGAFRDHAAPLLRTHPFIRLWVAGCSTGEEVYSLAILLHEHGLLERSQIYATDLNDAAVAAAAAGEFSVGSIAEYASNYRAYAGRGEFRDYYRIDGGRAVLQPFLRQNVIFARHNLATDASFNECHAIFCRNVLIYFNRALQARVHRLLYGSLRIFGYLGLGRSESMRFAASEDCYEALARRERLYRKIK
jgi:chemotaxis protein methyltransferase CheR